jgi:hypothetical protein
VEDTEVTIVELSRIVTWAELRPFTKTDYYGWAGVSAEGPHEIGETTVHRSDGPSRSYVVVRDGSTVEVTAVDPVWREPGDTWILRMEEPL